MNAFQLFVSNLGVVATPIKDPLGSFVVSHRGYGFSFILQCFVTVHFKLCTSRINFFVCLSQCDLPISRYFRPERISHCKD